MFIGVVREIKSAERRVALTPAGTAELVAAGHRVVVETGAGEEPAARDYLHCALDGPPQVIAD